MTTPMAHMPWSTYPQFGTSETTFCGGRCLPEFHVLFQEWKLLGSDCARCLQISPWKNEKNRADRTCKHGRKTRFTWKTRAYLWETRLSFPDHFMGQTQYSLNSGCKRFILQEVTKVHKSSSDFMPFTTGTARSSEYLMRTTSTKIPHLPICIHPPLVTK